MWPGQVNNDLGCGQSEHFQVYPQEHTQSIVQLTSQRNLLAQQSLYAGQPLEIKRGTKHENSMQHAQEACTVRLMNPNQSGNSNNSPKNSCLFQIVPKCIGHISGHPKELECKIFRQNHSPSMEVHLNTRRDETIQKGINLRLEEQKTSKSNTAEQHVNMPVLHGPYSNQKVHCQKSNNQMHLDSSINKSELPQNIHILKIKDRDTNTTTIGNSSIVIEKMDTRKAKTFSKKQNTDLKIGNYVHEIRNTDEENASKMEKYDTEMRYIVTGINNTATGVENTDIEINYIPIVKNKTATGIGNTVCGINNTGDGIVPSGIAHFQSGNNNNVNENYGIQNGNTYIGKKIVQMEIIAPEVRMRDFTNAIGDTTTGMWKSAIEVDNTAMGMKNTATWDTSMRNAVTRNTKKSMWNDLPGMEKTSIRMWENATETGDSYSGIGNIAETVTWTSPTEFGNSMKSIEELAKNNSNPLPKSKKFQTILTLQWLIENYETCEGYSVPRCFVYSQYTDFCSSNRFEPINPATFGKVIRQVFINLKTRRLGIRGQSKYHYYGIRVKLTSKLTHSKEHFTSEPKISKRWTVPNKLEMIPNSRMIQDVHQNPVTMELTSKTSTDLERVCRNSISPVTALGLALLPQFPKAHMLKVMPSNTDIHQVDVFLTDYRTHCEYLLEAILKGKFGEIYSIMMKFWQNLCASNLEILQVECMAGTIKFCDILLYKTIISILIPGTTQEVPPSLLKAVRIFAKDFNSKLSKYIQKLPKKVFDAKKLAATSFVKLLVRKSTLSHIAQATRSILNNSRAVKMMRTDWKEKTDLENLKRQIDWLMVDLQIIKDKPQLCNYFQEFDGLLQQKATVEQHVEWMEGVMEAFVEKFQILESQEKSMQNFVLYVSSISEIVLRDHTLRSASSFGSYHLLHMLYNEYLLYKIEATNLKNVEQELINQQIQQQFSERYSVPQLEKAVRVVYSELNTASASATNNTDNEPLTSPNTGGLIIVEDDNIQCNKILPTPSTAKDNDKQAILTKTSIEDDVKTSQFPSAILKETTHNLKHHPSPDSQEIQNETLKTILSTDCRFSNISPHPQKVVIAGKTALVLPELMSKTPSYVAAKVIKREPKSGENSGTVTGKSRKICKVNISPDQANNLFKGQLIDAEDGVQFIVNEVHNLPKGKSSSSLKPASTSKNSINSSAKVYHIL